MIYSVHGTLLAKELSLAVVECGGVGYACRTTFTTLSQLGNVGETVFLYTALSVRYIKRPFCHKTGVTVLSPADHCLRCRPQGGACHSVRPAAGSLLADGGGRGQQTADTLQGHRRKDSAAHRHGTERQDRR